MTVYSRIREKLSWNDVAREDRDSGGEGKRFFYCDVHGDEETADLEVHPSGGAYCHRNKRYFWDLTKYVADRDFNGNNYKAAKHLIQKHDLDINADKNLSEEQIESREKQQEVYEVLEDVVRKAEDKLRENDIKRLQETRNWDEETIETCRIGRMDEELFNQLQDEHGEILEDAGIHYGMTGMESSYCIIIPHLKRNKQPYLVTGMVPKQLRNRLDNSSPKYQQSKSTEWVSNDIYSIKGNSSDTVIITEGYPDAISAADHGYSTIAAGCGIFEQNYDQLKEKVEGYEKAVIVTDRDDTGEENLERTAEKLCQEIPTHIYRFEGKREGYDLDDWTSDGNTVEVLVKQSEDYINHLKAQYKDSSRDERAKVKEKLFRIIQPWTENQRQEAIKDFSGRSTISKTELKESFQDWEERKSKKTSELTEATEPDNATGNDESLLSSLADQEPIEGKRPVGRIEDTLFLTAWVQEGGREFPIILTSDGKWGKIRYKLKEIRKKKSGDKELSDEEKERYDYYYAQAGHEIRFKHEIPQRSLESINNLDNRTLKYFTGEKEVRDKEALWKAVKSKIKEYWSHYNEEWYDITAAYAAHTYILPVLGHTYYIILNGRPGTGKTQWQLVVSLLTYNGVWAGNLTAATAPRVAHAYMADIHQDEFEKKDDSELKKLQKLYNTGYQKDATYIQSNTDGKTVAEQITELQSFSSKTLTANGLYSGFFDSFMSRAIVLNSVQAKRDTKDATEMTDENRREFRQLQAEFGYYCLKNGKEIKEEVDKAKKSINESNREGKKIAIYKGITTHFAGEEAGNAVADRIRGSIQRADSNGLKKTDRAIFSRLVEEFSEEGVEEIEVALKELRDQVNKKLGYNEESQYQKTSKGVSNTLSDYDLIRDASQKYRGGEDGNYIVRLNYKQVVDSFYRYELGELLERIIKVGNSVDVFDEVLPEDSIEDIGFIDTGSEGSASSVPSPKAVKNAVREVQDEQGFAHAPVTEVVEHLKENQIYSDKMVEQALETDTEGTVVQRLLRSGDLFEPEPGKLSIMD